MGCIGATQDRPGATSRKVASKRSAKRAATVRSEPKPLASTTTTGHPAIARGLHEARGGRGLAAAHLAEDGDVLREVRRKLDVDLAAAPLDAEAENAGRRSPASPVGCRCST